MLVLFLIYGLSIGVNLAWSLSPRDVLPIDVYQEAKANVPEILGKYGYPVEIHNTVTDDGYILQLFRMPNPLGPPVLLVHGLVGSAADWVLSLPKTALAYVLWDAGFDVWLGNCRGNYYSHQHMMHHAHKRRFWDFSFHDLGYYDLPAMIDYALSKSGAAKLHYIGHSQGNTAFFAMASTRPEYNNKIRSMNAFAPVVYLTNTKNVLLRTFASIIPTVLYNTMTLLGITELLPRGLVWLPTVYMCKPGSLLIGSCRGIFPENGAYVNVSRIAIYANHYPSGASIKQLSHFAQVYLADSFRQYDYGWLQNQIFYRNPSPPSYDLKKVTVPVALHYSDGDVLLSPLDVDRVHNELGNSIGKFKVSRASFGHIDYLFATDAPELYNRTIEIMRRY